MNPPPEIVEWLKGELRFQKPSGTHLQQLLEDTTDPELKSRLNYKFQIFVIEHDWFGAFQNSNLREEIAGTQLRLVYDHCCYEFCVTGKAVCLIVNFDGSSYQTLVFVRSREGWWLGVSTMDEYGCRLYSLLRNQLCAVLVALDAAIVLTDVVRQPEKLNQARQRHGKLPLYDYHVVCLANRTRPATLPDESAGNHASPRLHFRRGHWRHFDNFKTWINWMLVGDPDLGFIEKHYRL